MHSIIALATLIVAQQYVDAPVNYGPGPTMSPAGAVAATPPGGPFMPAEENAVVGPRYAAQSLAPFQQQPLAPVGPIGPQFDPQVVAAAASQPIAQPDSLLPTQPVALPPPAMPVALPPPGIPAAAMPGGPPALVTREELQATVKKVAWTKGDFTIVPYGTIWGSMSYDTQRTRIGDYALWVESTDTHKDEPDFNVDAKSTRIGFDLTGPCIPCLGNAKILGKVEVDFQGQFATRNKPGLLLRHAYIEAKDSEFRLLVGQTWDVISPLAIPTLNYTAGSGVGNLAYRRAQFRAERYLAFSDTSMLTLQGSVNANVVTDFVNQEPNISADPGPYPDIQGRMAITLGCREGPEARPVVLGISGHVGEQDFDFRTGANPLLNEHIPSWSVDADLFIPFNKCTGFQGEFFTGSNLSNYMGGILQGVDLLKHRGIRDTGGWAALWYDFLPGWRNNTGFAIDDPLNADLTAGRTYNREIFTNVIYDATKNLQFGLECDLWRTGWVNKAPGEAVRLEFATKYKF